MNCTQTLAFPRRLVASLLVGLGAALPAQTLGLEVTPYDQQSGVPQDAADQLGISMVTTASKQMIVQLWGGKPGALAGIAIGRNKVSLPIFSARLLVLPDLLFFTTFDSKGRTQFSFPLIDKLRLYVQGIQIDLVKPSNLFTLTWGLEFATVMKQRSTAFDATLAGVLMDLSHDAYEDPLRMGRIKPGMRLAGGFQVLARLESPNPTNEPWFKAIGWPDTQLFVARNASADIAVVFRGTDLSNIQDLVTNLPGPIVEGYHNGKRLAYLSVHDKVKAALAEHVHGTARTLLTGHSLGGGLASIAANSLAATLATLGVAKEDVVLYSFGAARSMNAARAAELGANVPHHYAVANKNDIVTHFSPLFLEHIPQMRVLYPRRAMIVERGADYTADILGDLFPLPAGHYQQEYTLRLREILPPPKIWLSVSAGGNMQLNWSFPERAKFGFKRDTVCLFRGDPLAQGTMKFLLGGWDWATASGSYETSWPKGEGFHVAYVQEYFLAGERRFLATSGAFKSTTQPVLSLTKPNGLITLNWTYGETGKFDWVAVYQGIPTDPQEYLCGGQSWQWALGKTSHVTNWPEARGLYIGYVAQEALIGPAKIVKFAGPYDFVGKPSTRLTWKDNWPFYHLQVHYENARANTLDWVAIYDRDPQANGAIQLWSKPVTGTAWVQTLVAYKAGYYAAHFEKDCLLSPSKLVAKWGPLP